MPEEESRPGLLIQPLPDTHDVEVGFDTDGDKKPDFKVRIPIKDPRVWVVIAAIFTAVGGVIYFYPW